MVSIQTKVIIEIPKYCPKCEEKNVVSKLNHVNAINTKAKLYMVFCFNPKCNYCRDFTINNGETIKCH